MEAIYKRCWVLEIQNEVSTNQSGASTNHIGRSILALLVLVAPLGASSLLYNNVRAPTCEEVMPLNI